MFHPPLIKKEKKKIKKNPTNAWIDETRTLIDHHIGDVHARDERHNSKQYFSKEKPYIYIGYWLQTSYILIIE